MSPSLSYNWIVNNCSPWLHVRAGWHASFSLTTPMCSATAEGQDTRYTCKGRYWIQSTELWDTRHLSLWTHNLWINYVITISFLTFRFCLMLPNWRFLSFSSANCFSKINFTSPCSHPLHQGKYPKENAVQFDQNVCLFRQKVCPP